MYIQSHLFWITIARVFCCETGWYGTNCEYKCGRCENGATCYGMFGTCLDRCEPGFQYPLCQKACDPYTWGINCNMTCGKCRTDVPCDPVTGVCLAGCGVRIQETPRCDQGCEPGFYGPDCVQCGKCDGSCDANTGSCVKCQPGYDLPMCVKECIPGKYGVNCMQTCGHCKDGVACNHVTGECPDGCRNQWKGDQCNTEIHSLFDLTLGRRHIKILVGLLLGIFRVLVFVTTLLVGLTTYFWRRKRKREDEFLQYKNDLIQHHLGAYSYPYSFYHCGHTAF